MLVARKAFRSACKRNHAAGLFSGTKEERKEERVRRRQEVYVLIGTLVGLLHPRHDYMRAHEQME